MRFRTSLVLLACVAVAGCGGSGGGDNAAEPPASSAWATADEVRWLERLIRWDRAFEAARAKMVSAGADRDTIVEVISGPGAERTAYLDLLEPFVDCTRTLDADVGPAPSRRLAYVAGRLHVACGFFEKEVARVARLLEAGPPEVFGLLNAGDTFAMARR